ncbi:MAG: hypothetical protein EPGJADBJ_02321 [Saprospiraceae bacterium]|nr:hypothetical protein [Saprospiraceae bacterium]
MIALVFTGLCAWSAATAQIPPYHSGVKASVTTIDEAQPLEAFDELTPSRGSSNAWFPDFKGYVRANIRYPMAAREAGLEGVVYAEATVKTDGGLADIRIVDGLSYSCDREVVRLLSGMPAWKPAYRNGVPVEQNVYMRVRFQLKPF